MYHLCKEKYRLELHWDNLEYHSDSVVRLLNARFTGPVLKNSLRLESPDSIELDFTPQLLVVMDSYYIVTLAWTGCTYTPAGEILLSGVTLSNAFLKKLHKLELGDYIVINTEKHEEATHAFHLVYESKVVRSDGGVYDYRNV